MMKVFATYLKKYLAFFRSDPEARSFTYKAWFLSFYVWQTSEPDQINPTQDEIQFCVQQTVQENPFAQTYFN